MNTLAHHCSSASRRFTDTGSFPLRNSVGRPDRARVCMPRTAKSITFEFPAPLFLTDNEACRMPVLHETNLRTSFVPDHKHFMSLYRFHRTTVCPNSGLPCGSGLQIVQSYTDQTFHCNCPWAEAHVRILMHYGKELGKPIQVCRVQHVQDERHSRRTDKICATEQLYCDE